MTTPLTDHSTTSQGVNGVEHNVTSQRVNGAEHSIASKRVNGAEHSTTSQRVNGAEHSMTSQRVSGAEDSMTSQRVNRVEAVSRLDLSERIESKPPPVPERKYFCVDESSSSALRGVLRSHQTARRTKSDAAASTQQAGVTRNGSVAKSRAEIQKLVRRTSSCLLSNSYCMQHAATHTVIHAGVCIACMCTYVIYACV